MREFTADELKAYGRAVAEAVWFQCWQTWSAHGIGGGPEIDYDRIIASVPAPVMQHHAAPTCDGWWWALHGDFWRLVEVMREEDRVEPATGFRAYGVADFKGWVGPLRSPGDAD